MFNPISGFKSNSFLLLKTNRQKMFPEKRDKKYFKSNEIMSFGNSPNRSNRFLLKQRTEMTSNK